MLDDEGEILAVPVTDAVLVELDVTVEVAEPVPEAVLDDVDEILDVPVLDSELEELDVDVAVPVDDPELEDVGVILGVLGLLSLVIAIVIHLTDR